MAEVEVLSPPGERFCTAVGPLGYLNLLAGRAPGFVSPMLGAGVEGVEEDVVVEEDTEEEDEEEEVVVAAGGG